MNYSINKTAFILCLLITYKSSAQTAQKPIWQNSVYALYADSVVQQQKFVAKALSATELNSNYKSPANEFLSPAISFKFSINGKDNEMKSGTDHHFNCLANNGSCETPLIKFGEQFVDKSPVQDNTYLKPRTNLKIKLDMRDVLASFEKDGYYTTFNGDRIYKQDFKGIYVAGNTSPLIWDFDNLVNRPELKLTDDDNDGIYETSLTLNDEKKEKQTSSTWKLSKDISAFPHYTSGYPLSDAIYNLATEEMINAVEPDSTFRTGKEWAGVWTRDISYSIILSMAYLQPRVAVKSLLGKVNKNGKIIQDTGTGGSWPASSDRMIWAVAAWEVYKATGNKDWLQQAYLIIKNSVEDDLKTVYDKQTGLVKGESSFLDWREQTYPKWMQPVDIYESECLGTNAVHYQVNIVLSSMAALLDKPTEAEKYEKLSLGIKDGINKYLWMPEKGYYAQFLYGRNYKTLSPRSEALGEALSVLFGIADGEKQNQVIEKTPVMDFGIPCIYPQIPNIPSYHNNAVWPFVQSYWAMAAAKAGNEAAVMESISAVYRPAAMFTTNKENFVASNGDFAGTQINSSNMLWSLSGSLALIHKIIFGIHFNENSLEFAPFVPYALAGKRSLDNFSYREAILDIEMDGFGNEIKSFMLDGKLASPLIRGNLKGHHSIKIVLANNKLLGDIHTVQHYVSLPATVMQIDNNVLSWTAIKDARQYKVVKNGKEFIKTDKTQLAVSANGYAEYQIIAIDGNGYESFASEPLTVADASFATQYEIENNAEKSLLTYKGFSGDGFVEINTVKNTILTIPINIKEDGLYAIDFRYSNGNGPTNTENKCAIRTLKNNEDFLGVIVLPQRGRDEWNNWGWSNAVHCFLKKGTHTIFLAMESFNENMNVETNQAMLDNMRVIKIK